MTEDEDILHAACFLEPWYVSYRIPSVHSKGELQYLYRRIDHQYHTNLLAMTEDKVIVPTRNEIETLDFDSDHTHDLIRQAQEADQSDKQLTIGQAIKKYKKACFWAMILSVSLIMEGYDLVIVSAFSRDQTVRRGSLGQRPNYPSDYIFLWTDSISKPFWHL